MCISILNCFSSISIAFSSLKVIAHFWHFSYGLSFSVFLFFFFSYVFDKTKRSADDLVTFFLFAYLHKEFLSFFLFSKDDAPYLLCLIIQFLSILPDSSYFLATCTEDSPLKTSFIDFNFSSFVRYLFGSFPCHIVIPPSLL